MNQYKIFKHQFGDIEAVKQGWSWPGFFFNYVWALVKQLWKVFGIMVLVCIIYGIMVCEFGLTGSREVLTDAFRVSLSLTCGAFGNFWREDNLISRGYKLVHIVTAASAEDAVNHHLNSLE